MSSFLYRLGRRMARRARLVLVVWLVAFVGSGVVAVGAGGQLQDDLTIPGTEAQEGIDVLERQFPEAAGTSGHVLFVAPEGEAVRSHRADIRAVLDRLEDVDHVVLVTDPFAADQRRIALADDGRHALAQVQLDIPLEHVDEGTLAQLTEAALSVPDESPLEVHVGGSIYAVTGVDLSLVEALGVIVALVVLAITLGSLLAAGMPVITAVLGVGVAMAGLLTVASVTDISSSTPTLALMIGLAVGIDYALFIVSRHRGHLAQGMAVEESIARSSATAGSAVIFAGATVVIALCGLVVARIPFLAVMGFAAASAVAAAVLIALTAVPALLALAGEIRPAPGSRAARHAVVGPGDTHTLGARWVALATKVPVLTVVLVVAGLAVVAIPAKDLALGLPDNGTAPHGSTERVTYDLVADAYGPGYNAPLLVTVDIIGTTDPLGVMDRLGRDLGRTDGVEAVALSTPNPKADLGIVQLIPATAQADPETAGLVRSLRARAGDLESEHGVSNLLVTGHTAVTIDLSDRLAGALLPFGVVVVGLSLVLLTVVFRSIAVPIMATLGYLLSVAASFGVVTAVFEWGWFAETLNVARVGPVISFMPILLMGVLFGLAMDYQVFLVSRMREDYIHGRDAHSAVLTGFAASARVVTAAAVIMISVFAAFVPHGDASVKPLALGLGVGVFVDAFLVRMTLVPAALALLGDRAWWLPSWLDRRLPALDVEGSGLERHLEHEAWTREHGPAVVRAEGVRLPAEGGGVLSCEVDLVAPPGTMRFVRGADRVARRALLTALAGRLEIQAGRLVVLDRVLPAEAAAVRSRVHLFESFPSAEDLARIGRRGVPEHSLVLVDDVDRGADDVETARRWDLLSGLARRGVTVVAGGVAAPPGLPLDPITLPTSPTHTPTPRPELEEVTL